MVENIRQCDKDQARSGGLVNIESETCRENNKSGGDRNECIQDRNVHGFPKQCVIFSDVASEDRHGTDTEAESEECLVHSTGDGGDDTDLLHTLKIRDQVEFQTLFRTIHGKAVNSQDNHNDQKGDHHNLGNLFQAILKTAGTDKNTCDNNNDHPESHGYRLAKHICKLTGNTFRIKPLEFAGCCHIEVIQHPAGNGCVEHHQEITSDQSDISVDVPFLAWFLQSVIGFDRAFLAGTSNRKFHGHNRQSQDSQEDQIKQYECTATALSGHVREFPDVSDSDGTACRNQDESQTGSKFFSFFHNSPHYCSMVNCYLYKVTGFILTHSGILHNKKNLHFT